MAITRRKFLGMTAVTGASLMLPWRFGVQEAMAAEAQSPKLLKWKWPLRGLTALGDPNGIPVAAGVADPVFPNTTLYEITVGEYTDTLHPDLGPTTLRGYWDTNNPVKRHLGGLILATRGTASRIRFTNALPIGKNVIPNDPTVQTIIGIPTTENRVAVHLHGGAVPWISDGGPFDFWDPAGASGASFLNGPGSVMDNIPGKVINAGQADYFYPNDQSTRLMWYHDHAYGITRTNAYSGIATGYPIIDPAQEAALGTMVPPLTSLIPLVFQDKKFVNANAALGPLTSVLDPTWATVMAPRTDVTTTGSLWYSHVYDPKLYKLQGRNMRPLDPSAIPEFFGDTMLANGTVQPLVTVEAKRYRFWALNACNARFLNINLLEVGTGQLEVTTPVNAKTGLPLPPTNVPGPVMTQIGTEGGYLAAPVTHTNNKFFNPLTNTGNMLLGCAERADFIIDFTGMEGREFIMYNDAPGPFPAGPPMNDYFVGNILNPAMVGVTAGQTIDTRNILKFKVVPAAVADPQPAFAFPAGMPREPFLVPYTNTTAPIAPLLPPAGTLRMLTLNEDFDVYGRLRQLVGTTVPQRGAAGYGLEYGLPATETPIAGAVEVWEIYNLTADTHPMHFHLVDVQILSRQPFRVSGGNFMKTGVARGPEVDELGWKETCKCHPGEVITVCMKFDMPAVPFNVPFSTRGMGAAGAIIPQANEYVWHCHILEHEEHDMMRPLVVQGVNPVTPITVTPATQAVGGLAGGTASYVVGNAVNYTVVSSDPALVPVNTATGFDVVVPALSLPGQVTLTVSDKTGRTSVVVTLMIQ